MDNLETLLEELERFEKKGGNGTSKVLEEYIQHVAKTGDTLFPWNRIRYFMRFMLATVMNDFFENCGGGEDVSECGNVPAFSYVPTRDKILHHFDTFSGAPFTIQRLCEIMIDPTRHYKRTDKFLRGLEKNVLVVSHIEPGRQRRSEDPQQTLVNGMQDGGLHTSPISGSSRLSPSHQSKRLASPQPTNSISNNTNDFYDAELGVGESHVSGSEATGSNGIPLDERSIEAMAEIVEPLMKRRRMKGSPLEKVLGPMAHLAHLQDKEGPYMSISEAESLEAEGSDEESNASSSSSSSAKTDEEPMETGEAEATCHAESDESKTLEESLTGHQVGTSEVALQETENIDEDAMSNELKEEPTIPAEVCSSDITNEEEKENTSQEESSSLNLSLESSGSGANQGSPDSVEDTSEESQPLPKKKEGERAGSSEATAADLDTANETADISEGTTSAQQDEPGKDSHEADSTSQAQSNDFCSQPSVSGVGSSTSVTSCNSPPAAASTSTASAVSPVASPPSDTGGPTTSQISASASTPQPDAASTETQEEESSILDSEVLADDAAAATTSNVAESDSPTNETPSIETSESTDVELGSWSDTK